MRVVSNTSPISNLAIIGRLYLLRQRYGKITVPPAVADELRALTHFAAQEAPGGHQRPAISLGARPASRH